VTALTQDGMLVTFPAEEVMIANIVSRRKFSNIYGSLLDGSVKVLLSTFELCTIAPHVDCLTHNEIGRETLKCNLLSECARFDPISQIHYKFGHPSAVKTRHICKCFNLLGMRKLEIKDFEFLKSCETCRLTKATRSSFKGTMARAVVKGKCWYADIKRPFEQSFLIHESKIIDNQEKRPFS